MLHQLSCVMVKTMVIEHNITIYHFINDNKKKEKKSNNKMAEININLLKILYTE